MHDIICAQCGVESSVPFEPRAGARILCKACHITEKEASKEAEKRSRKSIPRKEHGTRVTLSIVCNSCGRDEVLDYVPKGTPLDEVICSHCANRRFGSDSKWGEVAKAKADEQRREWEFSCDTCGRQDYLKFEPQAERTYLCDRCFNEQESPSKERLQDKERIEGNVFIRKRKNKP